jgi:hypothetical protein
VSLGRRRRATGRQEKCIFHAHAKIGPLSPFSSCVPPRAFHTEWSGREGGSCRRARVGGLALSCPPPPRAPADHPRAERRPCDARCSGSVLCLFLALISSLVGALFSENSICFPPLPPAVCRNFRLLRLPSAVLSIRPPPRRRRRRDPRPPVTRAACGPGPACHRVPTSWTHGPHLPYPLLSDAEGVFFGVGFPRRAAVPG